MVEGLIFKCPLDEEDCECPFSHFRAIEGKDKFQKLSELTKEEYTNMWLHHKSCLKKKEGKR
jgi:hypothetical protein